MAHQAHLSPLAGRHCKSQNDHEGQKLKILFSWLSPYLLNTDRCTVNRSPHFASVEQFLSFSIALLPRLASDSGEFDQVGQVKSLCWLV
jgi:hypothetical protein